MHQLIHRFAEAIISIHYCITNIYYCNIHNIVSICKQQIWTWEVEITCYRDLKAFGSNSDLVLSWTLFIIIRSHRNSPLSPTIFIVLSSPWMDGFFNCEYLDSLSLSPFWSTWTWLLVILVAAALTPCRPFILVVWLLVAAILSKGRVEDNAHCHFLTDQRLFLCYLFHSCQTNAAHHSCSLFRRLF